MIGFIFFNLILANAFKIKEEFQFCQDDNAYVDLEDSCQFQKEGNSLFQKIIKNKCMEQLNDLKLLLKQGKNQYFVINNRNKTSIFHYNNGLIYFTNCLQVQEIEVFEQVEKCTKDLFVEYVTVNSFVKNKGFLSQEGIIHSSGKAITCIETPIYFALKNSNSIIVKINNQISITNLNNITNKKIETIYNSDEIADKYQDITTNLSSSLFLDLILIAI